MNYLRLFVITLAIQFSFGSFLKRNLQFDIEALLDDFMRGNNEVQELNDFIEKGGLDELQSFLYLQMLQQNQLQMFVQFLSFPLLPTQNKQDEQDLRQLSLLYARYIFEEEFPLIFNSKNYPNLANNIFVIGIMKQNNVDVKFELTMAEDQEQLELQFQNNPKLIIDMANSQVELLSQLANPTQAKDTSARLQEIEKFETCLGRTKKFLVKETEADEEDVDQIIESITEFKNIQNLLLKYLQDEQFRNQMNQIISNLQTQMKNQDQTLQSLFEFLQQNNDIAQQILDGDISQIDQLTKNIIDESKIIQDKVISNSGSVDGIKSYSEFSEFGFPSGTKSANADDDGSNVFLIITSITLGVGILFCGYRYIRRKAAENTINTSDGVFRQMD